LTETVKVCPICQARNQQHAAVCVTCGASIVEVRAQRPARTDDSAAARYDFRLGEADLAEASLSRRGRLLSAVLVLTILAAAAAIALLMLSSRSGGAAAVPQAATATYTRIAGPSVTPGPPSATFTSSPMPTAPPTDTLTPAPCMRQVAAGDSLIGIITGPSARWAGRKTGTISPAIIRRR